MSLSSLTSGASTVRGSTEAHNSANGYSKASESAVPVSVAASTASSGPGLSYFLRRDAGMLNGSTSGEAPLNEPPPRPPSYYAQKGASSLASKNDSVQSAPTTAPSTSATTSSNSSYSTLTTSSGSKSPTNSISTSPRKGTIGGVNMSIFESTVEAKTIFKDFKYYGGNLTTTTYTPTIISPSTSIGLASSGLSGVENGSSGNASVASTSPLRGKNVSPYDTLPKDALSDAGAKFGTNGTSESFIGHSSVYTSKLNSSVAPHISSTSSSSGKSTSHFNTLSNDALRHSEDKPTSTASYKVPYSSTNPFLSSLNSNSGPKANDSTATTKPKIYFN